MSKFSRVNGTRDCRSPRLAWLLGERARLPDHSALVIKFKCDHLYNCQDFNTAKTCNDLRFKLKQIPPDFMDSELARSAIMNLVRNIELARESQSGIDSVYHEFCDSLYD
jgi:hypothetical protein